MSKIKSGKTAAVVEITNADELQELVDAPIYCEFRLDTRTIRIPCKRVSQALDEQIRTLRRAAQPPYVKERNDYDYTNTTYLALKDRNEKTARAILVYACCPAAAAKKPGLTEASQIYDFVKGLWTENILELIALTVQGGGMELIERANFTSTPGSES